MPGGYVKPGRKWSIRASGTLSEPQTAGKNQSAATLSCRTYANLSRWRKYHDFSILSGSLIDPRCNILHADQKHKKTIAVNFRNHAHPADNHPAEKHSGNHQRQANQVQVSPLLIEVAKNTADVVLGKLQTNENGLSEEEVQERLEKHGPNVVAQEQRYGRLKLLGQACVNPLVILLLLLAALSDVPETRGPQPSC